MCFPKGVQGVRQNPTNPKRHGIPHTIHEAVGTWLAAWPDTVQLGIDESNAARCIFDPFKNGMGEERCEESETPKISHDTYGEVEQAILIQEALTHSI